MFELYHQVRLWCAFTTASMAIAFASSKNTQPKVRYVMQMGRRPRVIEKIRLTYCDGRRGPAQRQGNHMCTSRRSVCADIKKRLDGPR